MSTVVLSNVATNLPLVINFISVIVGTIGGICNLITFTAPQLRRNPSAFYLLCAAIFQILSLMFSLSTRMALDNFNMNLERQSLVFCKLRYYLSLAWPQLATYFILLASMDRYFATSPTVQRRAWSEMKVAFPLALGTLIGVHLFGSHTLFFYEIHHNVCQIPVGTVYTIFFAVYLILIVSLLPYLLMFIFTVWTFCNLRLARIRITPSTSRVGQTRRIRRVETQLIAIIVVQVILSSILVFLRLGSYLYSTLSSDDTNKSVKSQISEIFAVRLGIAFYYFSFAISFYSSTLTSRSFRQVFWKRVTRLCRCSHRM